MEITRRDPRLTILKSQKIKEACQQGESHFKLRVMEHHVYFWLKPEFKSPTERSIFEKALAGLFEIPLVEGGRWAVPAAVMPRPVIDNSWDYALSMTFRSVEDHDAYQDDADHHAFIDASKHRWEKVLVMDLA